MKRRNWTLEWNVVLRQNSLFVKFYSFSTSRQIGLLMLNATVIGDLVHHSRLQQSQSVERDPKGGVICLGKSSITRSTVERAREVVTAKLPH
jgi:hypothetical protein